MSISRNPILFFWGHDDFIFYMYIIQDYIYYLYDIFSWWFYFIITSALLLYVHVYLYIYITIFPFQWRHEPIPILIPWILFRFVFGQPAPCGLSLPLRGLDPDGGRAYTSKCPIMPFCRRAAVDSYRALWRPASRRIGQKWSYIYPSTVAQRCPSTLEGWQQPFDVKNMRKEHFFMTSVADVVPSVAS